MRDASGGRHRGRRARRGGRARLRACGPSRGKTARAGEQGDDGRRGRADGAHRPRERRGDRPDRLGAQRDPPGPSGRPVLGSAPADPHRFRRPVPNAAAGHFRRDRDRRRAAPPDVEDGPEDHDRFRDDDEQGPGDPRSAFSLRRRSLRDRGSPPPAVARPFDGGVLRRLRRRADGAQRHAFSHSLRARVSGAALQSLRRALARRRPLRVLRGRAGALSGDRPRARRAGRRGRGPGRSERRQRDRRRGVSSGKIRFPSIVRIVADTRTAFGRRGAPDSVAEAEEIDRQARETARELATRLSGVRA